MKKLEVFVCSNCKIEFDLDEVSAIEDDWGLCFDCIQGAKRAEKEEAWIKYPCCGGKYGCRNCLGV